MRAPVRPPRSASRGFTPCLGLALALLAPPVAAQQWARDMVQVTEHDFGVVARGSDTVYKFEVRNIYKEDVVLGSVRSSCGCTTASLEQPHIKTFQSGYVVARFNTRTFTGVHSATLTVDIVKPYPAQLQLRVHGNIRGDVVFEPGSVDFGSVDQGTPHERTIAVTYAGRSGWAIQDVRSVSDHLSAELVERERVGGRVAYDLVVRLTEEAPAGYLKTQLVIVTNDASNPRVPVDVAADVRPELTVSPENLVFGDVPQGETVVKRLLVRGKRPFRVTGVDGGSDEFSFDAPGEADTKQVVTVRLTPSRSPGRLRAPIVISTDLGESYTAKATAYATVVEPPADPAIDTQTALNR